MYYNENARCSSNDDLVYRCDQGQMKDVTNEVLPVSSKDSGLLTLRWSSIHIDLQSCKSKAVFEPGQNYIFCVFYRIVRTIYATSHAPCRIWMRTHSIPSVRKQCHAF